MRIRFVKECGFTLTHPHDSDVDEHFGPGDTLEGDIVGDGGEYVSFATGDGWRLDGLKKDQFEEVP